MTKAELINRMNIIIENSPKSTGITYHAQMKDWQKGVHNRTYFSIVEKKNGRYNKKKEYGYLDNVTGEYCSKYHDLRNNHTFGGNAFYKTAEQEKTDNSPTENKVSAPVEKFSEETMNKADELIKKYGISLAGNGMIRLDGNQAEKDNAIDEIKALKPAIIARLEEIKAEKERVAAERAAKIAAIEGLAEIKKAQDEIEEWNYRFNKSFEGEFAVGGMGVGKKPDYDLDAMYKKYPAARAYLRAEAESHKSYYEYAAIGRRALEAIINNPEDYENIMATMDAEISASVDRHLMTD